MRISGRNAAAAALGVLALTFLCGDLSAQGMPSFFKKQSSNRKRTDAPTVVEAATMDIDMENNIATLLGNVVVDDQDVKITCDKMVIHLEDKAETDESDEEAAKSETAESGEGSEVKSEAEAAEKPEEKKESAEKDSSDAKEEKDKDEKKDDAEEDDPTSGKQLKKIECFGEVVITHRADPNDSSSKEQVATSDYALYDVTANTITLTGRPVLTSGTDRLDAEKIVFDVETGRTFITTGKGTYYGDTPVGSAGGKKKK